MEDSQHISEKPNVSQKIDINKIESLFDENQGL
jgi:hypothetical protein